MLRFRLRQEIEYPLAIVILGGLVTSTLLNLFVVPSLYLRFGQGGQGGSMSVRAFVVDTVRRGRARLRGGDRASAVVDHV